MLRKTQFFLKDGRGRQILIINYVFIINYILSPRAETSSCQVRRFSCADATAPSGSALADVAVPKTRAVFRHRLIVYQKVKVQTLIMQENAGNQPKISVPWPKLLIPFCTPNRLCWSHMSLLHSGCASCHSIFSLQLLVWLFT